MTIRRIGVALALIVAILGGIMDGRVVAAAFLVAYLAILSAVLGVLSLRMIAFLSTATWFTRFRALAESVTDTLPALAIAGVAIIATQPLLRGGTASPAGTARALYDAPAFMALRFVFYWCVWLTLDARLRAAHRLEQTGNLAGAAHRYRIVSSAGLILLAVTMTFASFDWMMSLTPDWYSTAYGLYWIVGGLIGGLALLGFLAWRVPDAAVSRDDIHSLGKLLCTFVLLWVYIGFAQYIVIWSANIPSEVGWYVPRTYGAWGTLALVILLAGIALPFTLLLLRSVKRRLPLVGAIGALILVFHFLDTAWLLFPTAVAPSWSLAALCIAAVILLLFFVWLGARLRAHRSPFRLFVTR